jgi:hypothetical protein
MGFKRFSRVRAVDITQGDDIFPFAGTDVAPPHPADADAGNVQLFTGRGLSVRPDHMPGNDGKNSGRGGTGFDE